MRVIGMISGTSYDAIEVAVADLALDGTEVTLRPVGEASIPYPSAVHDAVAAVLPPNATTIEAVCRLDTEAGQAFAEAALTANNRFADGSAELVVSHGQTVFHWVDGSRARGTLQLGNPAWIAERTGLPVVSDLRSRDIAAGGHGAPLVSLFDVLLLHGSQRPVAALNLGGISNVTVVRPDADPIAFDVGPSNALIDAAVRHFSGGLTEFDDQGRQGARGRVSEALLRSLLADPYYALSYPKSTGKEYFNLPYLLSHLVGVPQIEPDDVIATLTRLTAETVAAECRRLSIRQLVTSGGGTRNPTLMEMLKDRLPDVELVAIDKLGIPSSAKEAYAFALLGFLTVHSMSGSVPSCTGAAHPSVLGSVTPGARPLELSPPGLRLLNGLRILS